MAERRDVELAQLRDREHLRCEREAEVRVRELRAQPRLRRGQELALFQRCPRPDGAPVAVELGAGTGKPEVHRCERAVAEDARLELLEMGERADVDGALERARQ